MRTMDGAYQCIRFGPAEFYTAIVAIATFWFIHNSERQRECSDIALLEGR